MRPTPALLRLALCLSSVAPAVLAWPEWLPARDSLMVRQDEGDDDSSTSAAQTGASASRTESEPAATSSSDSDEENNDDDEGNDDDLNTAEPTSEETGRRTGTRTSDRPRTTRSVPHDAAVGAANIMTPVTTAANTALFKIGDNITLSWNYTNLINEPTAVDVLISCSTASRTWTLTSNMTYETDVNFIWDSRDQEDDSEAPLLTEMYTLIIKDSEAEVSELPSPGELGAYSSFQFGMYHPIEYTPWPDWTCTGCGSAASALFDVQVVKLAFTMCFITIFTFTWFVTGWGIQ